MQYALRNVMLIKPSDVICDDDIRDVWRKEDI